MVRPMHAVTEKVIEFPDARSTKEKKPGRGAARLREAADEVLSRDSQALAEALSKNGQSGKYQSTKFMYELSEAGTTIDDTEDASKIRSMALELASAPPWTGPLPSETDDEMDEDFPD